MKSTLKEQVLPLGQPQTRLIPADQLVVYNEVQRIAPSARLVRDIADALDVNALGVLTVSQRKDGTYSLIDGQRRVAALKMRGMASHRCRCSVFSGLSVSEEAGLFRRLNRSRVVGAFDDFDKGVVEGDPVCVGVAKVCQRHGWKIGRGPGPSVAACVVALRKVWGADDDGTLLGQTIGVLTETFGRDRNTMSAHLVEGMSRFLAAGDVDIPTLTAKLRAKFAAPVSVITTARARMDSERGTMASNVAEVISRVYATRRRRS